MGDKQSPTAAFASATKSTRLSWANGIALFICALLLISLLVWRDVAQNRRLNQQEDRISRLEEKVRRQQLECSRRPGHNKHQGFELDETEVDRRLTTDQEYETGQQVQKIRTRHTRRSGSDEDDDWVPVFGNDKRKGDTGDQDWDEDPEDNDIDVVRERFKRGKKGKDKGKNKGKKKGKGEKGQKGEPGPKGEPGEPASGSGLSTVAAHFVGDREQGGAIQVEDGTINFWKFADWMDESDMHKFAKNADGEITVQEAGLYYVYSQVLYYDDKNMSHAVHIDDEQFLSCTHTAISGAKYNTCFTGGLTRLQHGSKVRVFIQYPNRIINMSRDSTFVGLVKLS